VFVKVVVDAHMLGEGEGGNETYIAGLLRGLGRLSGPQAPSITALTGPHGQGLVDHSPQVRMYPVGRRGDAWRLLAEVPWACLRLRADVVHMTYNAPPWLPCPLVLTVHDVIFRLFPNYFSPGVRVLLNTLLPLSMRTARVILTDSESSRRDIEHFYPFVRDKLVVVPIAPGPVSWTEPDYTAAQALSGGQPFILAVGTLQPRKNLARLIEAFHAVCARRVTPVRLLVVGRPDWQSRPVRQAAARSPYAGDILFTGYLDDATLAALYRTCVAFVFPSLYEGFGLPVLEAMACGAPVITSDVAALPEVAGDAARFVDPLSVESICEAMLELLSDEALRGELKQRGLLRAARFSWTRMAEGVSEAYAQAAGTDPARP
jgi:glycosyltransferase involved in cell wall biosynthesis